MVFKILGVYHNAKFVGITMWTVINTFVVSNFAWNSSTVTEYQNTRI